MSKMRGTAQGDLFPGASEDASASGEPPPDSFIGRIRDELGATLARVAAAETVPWPDATKALLAEMRFHSIANWLPASEAAELCRRFDAAMDRFYAEDEGGA
jgi:hypothetical protein